MNGMTKHRMSNLNPAPLLIDRRDLIQSSMVSRLRNVEFGNTMAGMQLSHKLSGVCGTT